MYRSQMLLVLAAAFYHVQGDIPEPPGCVIDRCGENVCTVETPEGTVDIPKKSHYEEGIRIECPVWLIEPT